MEAATLSTRLRQWVGASDAAETQAPPSPLDSYLPTAFLLEGEAQSASATAEQDPIHLMGMGTATAATHQRRLLGMLALGAVVLALVAGWVLQQADRSAKQLAATGQALMQSQRLAKSVAQAMVGNMQAFTEISESMGVLGRNMHALQNGDARLGVHPVATRFQEALAAAVPLGERTLRNAKVVLDHQSVLVQVDQSLQHMRRQAAEMAELTEQIAAMKQQHSASLQEVSAAWNLMVLNQRIGKSAHEFQTIEGVSPEAVFLLGKDLSAFLELAEGLLRGNTALRLSAARSADMRTLLENLIATFYKTRANAVEILGNLQSVVATREAQSYIMQDAEPLRTRMEHLQQQMSSASGISAGQFALLGLASFFVLACGVGISRVQIKESRARQAQAEKKRHEARKREYHAKKVNDATQAAIVRLMNELQVVAAGDLTQPATVTGEITGSIAESVNFTIEALRQLVGNVQGTAAQVSQTTTLVDQMSKQLLTTVTAQLREIRSTGQSVLDMAGRINEVSDHAQTSAAVARKSLEAADTGLKAVQNTMDGMNTLRAHIQDTAKRIKRLGESSQEIGEITELISGITAQTNVLALNAAIQAASAGEAGRGFSVVAQEVQRLAERSADATRQIASLVQAIQVDTQDAVVAMERSTQGVVEGARLSDSAGMALTEIDRVSRRLAELIEQISVAAQREAEWANEVAGNIQQIFVVTEQTGTGTRMTAQQVRALSRMVEALRLSVARFKIS